MFLKISQYSHESTRVGLSYNRVAGLKACNFIEKETPKQAFSSGYSKIFKNTFFNKTPAVVSSGIFVQ